ncbi:hypothetical protein Pelo_16537 [Pelomyxa schiedti]|nr:hypothetical protein Pelo_16537 [Pelomyxa schiedti]
MHRALLTSLYILGLLARSKQLTFYLVHAGTVKGLFYSVYIVSPLPTAVELTTYSDNPIYLWLLEHLCDYDSITQAVCLKHTESRWTSQNHVAQIVLEPLLNHSYFVLISTPSTVLSAPIAFSLYTSSVVGSSNAIDDGLSSVALFFAITASIAIPIGGGIALFAGIHYYQKRKSRSSADTKYHALSSMGPPDDDKASPHSNMMEELWSNTNTNATATTNPTLPTSTSNPTLDNSTPAPTPNNAAPSTPPATQPVSLI